MRNVILVITLISSGWAADNLEKTQKKELEAQVKAITAEAAKLEKAGQLAEARTRYAESQALIEMKEVTEAIKRLDDQIRKRLQDALKDSRKLYEARKFQEAAALLEDAMKLQAFQTVLTYDLALCYHQAGDPPKALEYLRKAKAGPADPKQKEKLQRQLLTYFTTGETGLPANDTDRDRIIRANRLAESVGLEASLEDEAGVEEWLSDTGTAPAAAAPLRKPIRPPTPTAMRRLRSPAPASAMRWATLRARWQTAPRQPSIWRIARKAMDGPRRRSASWKNTWRCRPPRWTAGNRGTGSPT